MPPIERGLKGVPSGNRLGTVENKEKDTRLPESIQPRDMKSRGVSGWIFLDCPRVHKITVICNWSAFVTGQVLRLAFYSHDLSFSSQNSCQMGMGFHFSEQSFNKLAKLVRGRDWV